MNRESTSKGRTNTAAFEFRASSKINRATLCEEAPWNVRALLSRGVRLAQHDTDAYLVPREDDKTVN